MLPSKFVGFSSNLTRNPRHPERNPLLKIANATSGLCRHDEPRIWVFYHYRRIGLIVHRQIGSRQVAGRKQERRVEHVTTPQAAIQHPLKRPIVAKLTQVMLGKQHRRRLEVRVQGNPPRLPGLPPPILQQHQKAFPHWLVSRVFAEQQNQKSEGWWSNNE